MWVDIKALQDDYLLGLLALVSDILRIGRAWSRYLVLVKEQHSLIAETLTVDRRTEDDHGGDMPWASPVLEEAGVTMTWSALSKRKQTTHIHASRIEFEMPDPLGRTISSYFCSGAHSTFFHIVSLPRGLKKWPAETWMGRSML